ncbi:hypothetical protein MMC24_000186 [Lignoscripta atroalba]|nr:hypothetical protein [Lignoscripta atroalba]
MVSFKSLLQGVWSSKERKSNFLEDEDDDDDNIPTEPPLQTTPEGSPTNTDDDSEPSEDEGFPPTHARPLSGFRVVNKGNNDNNGEGDDSQWSTVRDANLDWSNPTEYAGATGGSSPPWQLTENGTIPLPRYGDVFRGGQQSPTVDTVPYFHHDPLAPWDPDGKRRESIENSGAFKDLITAGVAFTKPPTVVKSYWDGEKGPVTREHFEEYKQAKEEEIRQLSSNVLQAASSSYEAKASVLFFKEEAKKAEEKAKMYQGMDINEWERYVKGHRGKIRVPQLVDENTTENRAAFNAMKDEEKGKFLYDNFPDRCNELRLDILLLRMKARWSLRDWKGMDFQSDEAITIARQLDYAPLVQRCQFYKAIAQFGMKQYWEAADLFDEACWCVGVYKEGTEAHDWRTRAERAKHGSSVPHTSKRSSKTGRRSFFGSTESEQSESRRSSSPRREPPPNLFEELGSLDEEDEDEEMSFSGAVEMANTEVPRERRKSHVDDVQRNLGINRGTAGGQKGKAKGSPDNDGFAPVSF